MSNGMYANLFGTKFFQNVHMTNGSDDASRLNLASEPDLPGSGTQQLR